MKNKGGQIYLIATVIIISIISGVTFLSDYYKKDSSTFVYDTKKQLETESEKVFDYGFANEQDVSELIENFTKDFSDYAEGVKIYFATGQIGNMDVYYYENGKQSLPHTETAENISFYVDNMKYSFELNEGENFYFVITQNIGGENYVATSE